MVQRLRPLQPQRGLVPRGSLQEQVPGWNILGWVQGRFLLLESSSDDDQTYRLRTKISWCSHIEFSVFELQKNKILLFNHCFAQPAPAKSRSTVFLSSFPSQVPLSFIRTLLYCDSVFLKHTFTKADVCACKAYLSFFQDQHAWCKQSKLVKNSRSLTRYKLFQFKKLMLFQVSSTLKCKYVKWHCLALMWKLISYLTIYLKMLVLLSMKNLTTHYCLIFTPRTSNEKLEIFYLCQQRKIFATNNYFKMKR